MDIPHHKHLRRLPQIWERNPRYFITVAAYSRRTVLNHAAPVSILIREWENSLAGRGWAVGSYVIMPNHFHFFCTDAGEGTPLSTFIGKWKEWTAKRICAVCDIQPPLWQPEFFDHLLRSSESYSEKWNYVRNNPVRAGLVANADDWPFSGYIHYR